MVKPGCNPGDWQLVGTEDGGFGEFGQGFEAAPTLETYEAIYRLVLSVYGYRCALTGEQFGPDFGLIHPHLEVIAIRPREAGGPLQINNYLALEEHAARAFGSGLFLVEDDYQITVPNPDALPKALAVRLHPGGRLLVPREALFQPSPAHLAFHRRTVLGA
jgi:predicted restriction endonuclease